MRLRDILKARRTARKATKPKEKIMGRLGLGKGLLRSKTFWVNLLAGAVAVLGVAGSIPFLPATPWLAAALAIANILLRVATKEPITSVK